MLPLHNLTLTRGNIMTHYKKLFVIAGAAALLTACGGSSSSSSGKKTNDNSSNTSTAIGVLSDSPVDGVGYQTSGGKTGITQDGGKFNYTLGDTVTFTLGEFILGSYKPTRADETVTPVELASAIPDDTYRDYAITNLLVLLQSLDTDGDPSNGININAGVTFSADSLTLIDDPATFATNQDLIDALPEGGTVVSPEDANAHFNAQRAKDLAGIYYASDFHAVLRINSDRGYIVGQLKEEDDAVGIEVGNLTWDVKTGEVRNIEVRLDTQTNRDGETEGVAGLDNADDLLFKPTQTQLLITDGDEEFVFKRFVPATGNNIVGAWAAKHELDTPETSLHTQQFIFFDNGKYVMFDPLGDEEPGEDPCGFPGVEAGHYTVNAGNINLSNLIVDTNGCGGLHDFDDKEFNTPIPYSIDANTMTWNLGDEGMFKLERIKTIVN